MTDAYIYDAVRTPRGKGRKDGALHEVTPVRLAVTALEAIRDRNKLDTHLVDDVVLGCVMPIGEQGADIARTASVMAGYAESVSGVQINRFCASGLEATNMAAAQVMSGQSQAAIGGGVESMSRVPMGSDGGAWAVDPAVAIPMYFVPQGVSADLIATKYGMSRDDVDAYAVESQKRAKAAWDAGYFKKSIVPVKDQNGVELLNHDELMRPTTTMQTLAALEPSFKMQGEMMPGFNAVAQQRYPEVERITHVHHAGNSSGVVDGAAAVLLTSKEYAEKNGLKPRARIVAYANIGDDPTLMLNAPVPAAKKVLEKAGLTKNDIDVWEINEAFAVVAEKFIRDLDLDREKVNINGGAMALGHPIGATGSILIGTALDELERSGGRYGLVTMCAAGGMAPAIIIERV
ncbi:MAG: acetyl-CoA C-acetyltransferase [Reyranella sp.]|nr:acetyl-CoA C-acetyltransferase [Reyranella sp.]